MQKSNSESEGVLMVILYDPIFGLGRMIIFHLIEWVTTFTKTSKKALNDLWNRSAFPVPARNSRHEITCKSSDREDINDYENAQN